MHNTDSLFDFDSQLLHRGDNFLVDLKHRKIPQKWRRELNDCFKQHSSHHQGDHNHDRDGTRPVQEDGSVECTEENDPILKIWCALLCSAAVCLIPALSPIQAYNRQSAKSMLPGLPDLKTSILSPLRQLSGEALSDHECLSCGSQFVISQTGCPQSEATTSTTARTTPASRDINSSSSTIHTSSSTRTVQARSIQCPQCKEHFEDQPASTTRTGTVDDVKNPTAHGSTGHGAQVNEEELGYHEHDMLQDDADNKKPLCGARKLCPIPFLVLHFLGHCARYNKNSCSNRRT